MRVPTNKTLGRRSYRERGVNPARQKMMFFRRVQTLWSTLRILQNTASLRQQVLDPWKTQNIMFREACRRNRHSHLSCTWMHQERALGWFGTKTSSVNTENPLCVFSSFNLPNSLPYYGTEKQVLAFLIRVMQRRQMFRRFLKQLGMFQFWAESLLSQSQITLLLCKSATHTLHFRPASLMTSFRIQIWPRY